MSEMRIGEVAARSDLAASAIRYYESEGLIPRPARRSGHRVYDESVLDRLALIELAKRAGFTMSEIKRLLAGFASQEPPSERWSALTCGKLAELDERIEQAQRMKEVLQTVMRCRCPTFDDCSRVVKSRSSP